MDNFENQNRREPERKTPKKESGFAVASLIVGLFGILTLCCSAFPVAIIMGVGAVCFAVISKNGEPFCGLAIAGIVLGVIAVLGGVAEFALLMAFTSLLDNPEDAAVINQLYNELYQEIMQMPTL